MEIIEELERPAEKVGTTDPVRIKKLITDYNNTILHLLEGKYNMNQKGPLRIKDLRLEVGFPVNEPYAYYNAATSKMETSKRLMANLYLRTDEKVFYSTNFYTEFEDNGQGSLIRTICDLTASIMRHGLSHFVKNAKPLSEELI